MTPTQAWLDAQQAATADLPEHPGASVVIEFHVTGTDVGEVVFTTELTDGRISSNRIGPADEAQLSMTMPAAVWAEVAAGALALDVGFMQGRIKVVGDIGRLLSVLPVTTTDAWRTATASATA